MWDHCFQHSKRKYFLSFSLDPVHRPSSSHQACWTPLPILQQIFPFWIPMLTRQSEVHHDDIIFLLINRLSGIFHAGEHCGGIAQYGPSTKIIWGIQVYLASIEERELFLGTEPSPQGLGMVDRLSAGRLCRSSRMLLQGCTLTGSKSASLYTRRNWEFSQGSRAVLSEPGLALLVFSAELLKCLTLKCCNHRKRMKGKLT